MKPLLVSACLLGVGCRYDGRRVIKIDVEKLTKLYNVIPFCPEVYGGLPTPRIPSERVGDRVKMADGTDVTEQFMRGAKEAYDLCARLGCDTALLKERSPSCGTLKVYDGSFTGRLVPRMGVCAEYLRERGIRILSEDDIDLLFDEAVNE